MNAERIRRILEIKDWLCVESSARFKPYPKGRHPVAFKARMMALGFKAKDATEEDVQMKKRTLERELERLETQEKADAEKVRSAKDNAGGGAHGDSVVPLPSDRVLAVSEKRQSRRGN